MLDIDDMSTRMQRYWRDLLVAADNGNVRRIPCGSAMHDRPSGQPQRVCGMVNAARGSGWLRLDVPASLYRLTDAGGEALAALQERIDQVDCVTVSRRA
ncbi:hypothetical protein I0C86_41675 [Plantactinospora sp. S1510]|uniref:Uncharacterized protein n=1 Tax=Plantactinospora alkalitolerans TaxID=2789879 RepID=A0ABS0HA58_9ACTN|nr:hypothetical protein [Plantactinospora alkalitolerans]MBF9135364.1 hypothetical protein [Plantactinospora alkalitolerans]